MVPPGLRGGLLRDGGERGLHLRGLLREGDRSERGDDRRGDGGGRGGGGGERRGAVDVRHGAGRTLVVGALVVFCASREPGDLSSAAGPSADQLAPNIRQELST